MATGCSLYPALCDQERALPWSSTRQGENYKGVHDRFLRDQVFRASQLKIGWTEQKCTEMDELAQQDHTYHLSTEEFKRYQGQWYLTLNKSGKNAPMRLRSYFRAVVSLKNRVHRESGEEIAEPTSPQQYRIWHSSSSDSWWDTSKSWWSSRYFFERSLHFFATVGFVCSRWRSTVTNGVCRQEHLTRHFSPAQCACRMMCHTTLVQVSARARQVISMVIHDERLSVCSLLLCSSLCSFPCVFPIPCSSLSTSTCTLSWTSSSMWTTPRQITTAPPPNEESCTLAEFNPPTDELDVNMAIWGILLNTTLQAAVHLGQVCETKLRYVKNHLWYSVGQLFNETGKLISEQTEITGVSTFDFKDATWMSTSLLCSKAYQYTNAKTYVFPGSVLCVGKMADDPIATWKSKMKWYSGNNH